jgi:single-strand DNA-binding protein
LVKFSVANNTGFGDRKKTQFFDCVMWGNRAESLNPYLKKGNQVGITGTLESNDWTGRDGTPHKSWTMTVNDLQLMGEPKSNSGVGYAASAGKASPKATFNDNMTQNAADADDANYADDIPF